MMAASALHMTAKLSSKTLSLGAMSKRLIDQTRHAWQDDDESFEAILKVSTDYENGLLWFSKADEKKWKTYAAKHNLDDTVDVQKKRRRMEKNWLRPLTRVPQQYYKKVAKDMGAQPVVDGKRASQKYFFNAASSSNPPKQTLAWVVDRMQRREAVKNALRWMMVENGGATANTIAQFLALHVRKFGGYQGKQFRVLGDTITKEMKNAWAVLPGRLVEGLRVYEVLIPPIVRQHYTDIASGGRGYEGYSRDVGDLGAGRWDWQFNIPWTRTENLQSTLPIRGFKGLFVEEYIHLGGPCLWVFDCRRGAMNGPDEVWRDVEYRLALEHVQKWMTGVLRWTAIFLFPPGVFFEEKMRLELQMPEHSMWLRGMWVFESGFVSGYDYNLKHLGRIDRTVQAFGDIGIILQHPNESKASENVRHGTNELPVLFKDKWTIDSQPCATDQLERTPTEVRRLVQMYLPEGWHLVACGITTAIPEIISEGFVGCQIIVLDSSSVRTTFLQNTLKEKYGRELQMISNIVQEADPMHNDSSVDDRSTRLSGSDDNTVENIQIEESESLLQGVVIRAPRQRRVFRGVFDDGADEGSGSESSSTHDNEDSVFERGDSLGSKDTPDEEDIAADITSTGDSIRAIGDEVPTNVPVAVVEATVIGCAGIPLTSDIPSMSGILFDSREAAEFSIPIHSERLPISKLAMEMDNATLSFGVNMANQGMVQRADGYYYDFHSVRYRRVGVEGQFRYEEVASIFQDAAHEDHVSSSMASDMVARAQDLVDPMTALDGEVQLLEQERNIEEEIESETQLSERIFETP